MNPPELDNGLTHGQAEKRPNDAYARAERFLQSEGVTRLLADVEAKRAVIEEREAMPTGQEVRVVDAKTGGAKGSKLARFDLIPPDVMWALAEHYGRGARKYADRNWEQGFDWSLAIAALERHFALFKQGIDVDDDPALYLTDDEDRSLHIISVVWQAVCLAAFLMRGIGTDDRAKL